MPEACFGLSTSIASFERPTIGSWLRLEIGLRDSAPGASLVFDQAKMSRVQQLLSKIVDSDADDWSEACDALGNEATGAWLPELRAAFLSAPDYVLREALAEPLARFGGASELPLLLEGARKGEEEGHDNDSLNAAICDLVEAVPVESFALLETFAASEISRTRRDAAWLLGFVDTKESFSILARLIRDPDIEVAKAGIFSITGLASGDGRTAIKALPFFFRLSNRGVISRALMGASVNQQ